jgi:hypothetical protein
MSIVVRFNPTGLPKEQYDATLAQLTDGGDFPPDGLRPTATSV